MSNKEKAIELINQIPEDKLAYVVYFLQGAALSEFSPNAETVKAMDELNEGGGQSFSGSTEALFKELAE